ncbi:hypothetical protein ACIHEJ_25840 [Streptomyces sp. NPDC052301]|uniref:hypothetical protein n=1 Tax=Streptomyces sp. NPDC052301 TaxID=3365687 RepID=UPI0037D2FC8F
MTSPAALFGATVRALRTGAARRALQLVLLVGGLFVLGFLCGEQAQAAERIPAPVQAPVRATSVRSSVTAPEDPVDPVRAMGKGTVRAVSDQVVAPVRDVVNTATQALEATTSRSVDEASRSVDEASRSVGQARPTAPSLPLPDVTEASVPPGHQAAAPKGPAPRPQRHIGTAAAKSPAGRHSAHTVASAPAPAVAAFGPAAPAVLRHAAWAPAPRTTTSVGDPGRPAPTGDPDGVLGKQAADGSTTRHGDACAVTFVGRAPLRLPPGATARADAPETRERHRDIPVFPG